MARARHPHVTRAKQYARDVVAGRILACRWVRLACQRFLDDLKRSRAKAYPYKFDLGRAERACQFAELLPHVKGHWAHPKPGDPGAVLIKLEPWQAFIRSQLYGWVTKGTALRRFQTAYQEIPRKNAKSTGAAIDGLYFLAADGEMGAEVYSGAVTEKQAWETFRPARLMAERTPAFCEQYGVTVNASNLAILSTGSRFEPIIGKPGDGASPSLAIVDEYHEHPDSVLFETMETGMGVRQQPLLLVITTAGDNIGGPCYALREQVCRMLDGSQPNDRLFGIIYTIDEQDDWTTVDALQKANPNYDVSVSGNWLQAQQRDAIASSRKQNVFKRKHLNIWTSAREAWLNMEWWHRQGDATLRAAAFAGSPCYASLDLSSKLDLTAVVRVFRVLVPGDAEPHFYVFGRYYAPLATVQDPKNAHLQGWAHDLYLTATEGEVTDYARIREELLADAAAHGLEAVAGDPWGAGQILQELTAAGLQAIEIPQNVKNFSEPMKWVEALVKAGRLHHDANPCLAWMVSNVTCREDPNENIFPRKDRPENKIDGAVALIMALGRAMLADAPAPVSIYEERGLDAF